MKVRRVLYPLLMLQGIFIINISTRNKAKDTGTHQISLRKVMPNNNLDDNATDT
jgi:hypothetical protein